MATYGLFTAMDLTVQLQMVVPQLPKVHATPPVFIAAFKNISVFYIYIPNGTRIKSFFLYLYLCSYEYLCLPLLEETA